MGVKCAEAQDAEGHLSVITNLSPTETSYGLSADYTRVIKDWTLETDGQLQSGLQTTGLANLSLQRNFGSLGFRPYAEIVFSAEGRQQDFGFVGNFLVSGIELSVGGSFRNANPLEDTGIKNGVTTRPGYVIATGKYEESNTFSFEDTESLNLIVATQFPVFGVDTDVKASIPVKQFGIGTAYPQIVTRSVKTFKVQGIDLNLIVDFRFQITPDNVEFEKAIAGGFGISF